MKWLLVWAAVAAVGVSAAAAQEEGDGDGDGDDDLANLNPDLLYDFREFDADGSIVEEGVIDYTKEVQIAFLVTTDQLSRSAPRVLTSTNGSELTVAVRHPTGHLGWQHPMKRRRKKTSVMGKTICIADTRNRKQMERHSRHRVVVSLSTSSNASVDFRVEVIMVQKFFLEDHGRWAQADVRPNAPEVWAFRPNEERHSLHSHGQTVRVHVKSTNETASVCGLVAVQPMRCPLHDDEADVQFHSMYKQFENN